MPKVSIVIPVYGVEKYIERCARSLFEQTLDDIEYIFVDDCTTDRSVDVLRRTLDDYPQRQKQVRIEKMSSNSGLAAVRRHGILLSRGEYLLQCDSDDWMDRDMCKTLYEEAMQNDYDVVVCDYYRSDGNSRELYRGYNGSAALSGDNALSALLCVKMATSIWNKMVKRTLFFDNDIQYPMCDMWEDFVLSSQIMYYGRKIGYVRHPFYYYFYNRNSICNKSIDIIFPQILTNANTILEFLEAEGLSETLKDEIGYFKYYSRSELVPYIWMRKYHEMWIKTYPEINKSYVCNPCFPLRDKVKFWMMKTGLYSAVLNLRGTKREVSK